MENETLEQKIVRLYYDEKHSIRQVCVVLKCSPQTVKKNLIHGVRSKAESLALRSSDDYREKLRQTQTGKRNHQAKLTEKQVLEIRASYGNLLGTFNKSQSQYILADEYGVKRPTISDIVLRKTWKHI